MLVLETEGSVDDRQRLEPIQRSVEQCNVTAALTRKHAHGLRHAAWPHEGCLARGFACEVCVMQRWSSLHMKKSILAIELFSMWSFAMIHREESMNVHAVKKLQLLV